MLEVGIVGLPNVGKSTLFNAVTQSRRAEAANYPFCTIEPNKSIVEIPDERMKKLSVFSKSKKKIPTALEFVDIAGLVEGASEGAGLGNQFLNHIRSVDAIIHVVRCFEDENIIHELGRIDSLRDTEIIESELLLADISMLEKRRASREKKAKSGERKAIQELNLLEKILPTMNEGTSSFENLSEIEISLLKSFRLLSGKSTILACNVKEIELATALKNPESLPLISSLFEKRKNTEIQIICSQLEAELSELSKKEAEDYLSDLGVKESGCDILIQSIYKLLNLETFFTTGGKETRAWTIQKGIKAPVAGGKIHTDIQRGFIAAEVINTETLLSFESRNIAKEAGEIRIEGKEYCVQDGDVIEFRFNV